MTVLGLQVILPNLRCTVALGYQFPWQQYTELQVLAPPWPRCNRGNKCVWNSVFWKNWSDTYSQPYFACKLILKCKFLNHISLKNYSCVLLKDDHLLSTEVCMVFWSSPVSGSAFRRQQAPVFAVDFFRFMPTADPAPQHPWFNSVLIWVYSTVNPRTTSDWWYAMWQMFLQTLSIKPNALLPARSFAPLVWSPAVTELNQKWTAEAVGRACHGLAGVSLIQLRAWQPAHQLLEVLPSFSAVHATKMPPMPVRSSPTWGQRHTYGVVGPGLFTKRFYKNTGWQILKKKNKKS